jgi:hypothetical protein
MTQNQFLSGIGENKVGVPRQPVVVNDCVLGVPQGERTLNG